MFRCLLKKKWGLATCIGTLFKVEWAIHFSFSHQYNFLRLLFLLLFHWLPTLLLNSPTIFFLIPLFVITGKLREEETILGKLNKHHFRNKFSQHLLRAYVVPITGLDVEGTKMSKTCRNHSMGDWHINQFLLIIHLLR